MARSRKRLELSAVAVVDNIVFSKTGAMAFFRLPNDVFDFLSTEQKAARAAQLSNGLTNLVSSKQEPLECMIITTSVPVDVDAWVEQVRQSGETWEQSPGFEQFLARQAAHLESRGYMKRVCYLGVSLGRRGALDMSGLNVLEAGFKAAFETFQEWLSSLAHQPGETVSASEEALFRKREEAFHTIVKTGNLHATRCTAEELLLFIKRMFYPGMPAPYLDVDHSSRLGPGDLEMETCSVIEHRYRWLRCVQMFDDLPVEGYRATLTFASFPKEVLFPGGTLPFFYFPAKLGAPFTLYSRFKLLPSSKMKSDLEKKKQEQKDELSNLAKGRSGVDAAVDSMPSELVQSLEDARLISDMLVGDKTPWVEGTYRVVVEASSEERLKEYCSQLKQEYDDLGITVQWTAGDQLDLFLEQMPGDHLRTRAFKQVTNLAMISAGGFNISSDIGDRVFRTDVEVTV